MTSRCLSRCGDSLWRINWNWFLSTWRHQLTQCTMFTNVAVGTTRRIAADLIVMPELQPRLNRHQVSVAEYSLIHQIIVWFVMINLGLLHMDRPWFNIYFATEYYWHNAKPCLKYSESQISYPIFIKSFEYRTVVK